MTTANTPDCFRTFIGHVLRGCFQKGGDSYLIFADGRALVLHHETGAYWVAMADDVARELNYVASRLKTETDALKNVLALAGKGEDQ
jgi:molybdopterin-guanine dinucleotide biosynthesis protein